MPEHIIGSREEVQAARDALAKLEAEQAERNEEIKRKRRELPWVPVETEYDFDTRLLPADFPRRVVRERLGLVPDEIDAGHCVALSRPEELASHLDAYRACVGAVHCGSRCP